MKKILCLIMALAMVASLVACGSKTENPDDGSEQAPPEIVSYSVGCSASGGAYNIVSTGWCTLMNQVFPDKYSFTAETTGGASANTALIETGECMFGVGGAGSTFEAYNASAEWTQGQKMLKSRAMWPMYAMSLTCFCMADSGINSLNDLAGKTVACGSQGSGSLLSDILPAIGIDIKVHNDTWANSVAALKDGTIDAVITMAAGAWPSLVETEATHEVKVLSFTDEQCEKVMEAYPYFVKSTIPAGTYKCNANEDIQSCAQWAYAICSEDLSADVVYELTKATFEHYDDMTAVYAGLGDGLKLENIPQMPFLFHEGAIKYYEENGVKMADIAAGFDVK